jgi:ATP-dependent Clp protease adapter protein ClpS
MAKRNGDPIMYFVHTPGESVKYFKTKTAAEAYVKKRDAQIAKLIKNGGK